MSPDAPGQWLVCGDHVLCSLVVAADRRTRRRGLLDCDAVTGAMWFPSTRSVHTFGMRQPIDVAFCDLDGVVLRLRRVGPYRVTLPRRGVRQIVEAEAGAFERWTVAVGDRLEIR